MANTRNAASNALHDETAQRELLEMLQIVIAEGGGLSAIRQLLDEAKSMPDIRARFADWQRSRCTALSDPLASSQTMRPTSDSDKASKLSH